MKKFTDPDFRYHSNIVKVVLRLVFDIADAQVLPFDLYRMSSSLEHYGKDLQENNDDVLSKKNISLGTCRFESRLFSITLGKVAKLSVFMNGQFQL